jgi:hypothetical protein
MRMKKKLGLILMVFAISFLTSCASNDILISKNPGSANNYSVNDKGTVEILGEKTITDMHWMYVECDHWSGCYVRCQGQLDSCKQVETESKYIHTRPGWQK